jgi:hypothetical protein
MPAQGAAPVSKHRSGEALGARNAPLQRPAGSLGSFIAGFKASCTRQINHLRNLNGAPVWQRGYWEHIVRDEDACARIYEYVETNPLRWERDRENPDFPGDDSFHVWLRITAPAVVTPLQERTT